MSTNSVARRISKEWKMIEQDKDEYAKIEMVNGNMRDIIITLRGGTDTPYEGGVFKVRMCLTEEYPIKPPKVFFQTPIYHPNINKRGDVCLDILKDNWSPAIQITKVVQSILCLLSDPNTKDPLNNEAARLWDTDKEAAEKEARRWVKLYATPKD